MRRPVPRSSLTCALSPGSSNPRRSKPCVTFGPQARLGAAIAVAAEYLAPSLTPEQRQASEMLDEWDEFER